MLRKLGIAALVAGAVMGCGSSAAERAGAAGAPPVWVDVACPSQDLFDSSGKRGGIPTDFVPAAVVRCRTENRHAHGDGVSIVRITERADLPVPRLVEMLRRPSAEPRPVDCPAIGHTVPYFLLVNEEGNALAPAIPTELCGEPRAEVVDTLDFLPYRVVAETLVAHTNSTTDNCYDRRKDVIATEPPQPAPATPVWPDASDSFSVCVYRVSGEAGHLENEFSLSGQEAVALKAALSAAGPAQPCDKPHTRFATMRAPTGSDALVELDGCLRFLRPDNTFGQLDENVVAQFTR